MGEPFGFGGDGPKIPKFTMARSQRRKKLIRGPRPRAVTVARQLSDTPISGLFLVSKSEKFSVL